MRFHTASTPSGQSGPEFQSWPAPNTDQRLNRRRAFSSGFPPATYQRCQMIIGRSSRRPHRTIGASTTKLITLT